MNPRISVIGCGEHGSEVLIPSLRSIGADIVGVRDLDPVRAAQAAARWTIPNTWSSAEEAIETADAVVCALPGPVNFEVADLALAHGKFVLVEKPPGVTNQQLEALRSREASGTATCGVGFNMRFCDGVRELRHLASGGKYGRIAYARVTQLARKPHKTLWGEPLLHSLFFAQGIHAVDLLHLLIEDLEVCAARRLDVESGAALVAGVRGRSGVGGEVIFGSCAGSLNHRVDLMMSSGAWISLTNLNLLTVTTGVSSNASKPPVFEEVIWGRSPLASGFRAAGYEGELAAFVATVEGRPDPLLGSLDDAAATFETFNGMLTTVDEVCV
jgi:predicted dehydrogenase